MTDSESEALSKLLEEAQRFARFSRELRDSFPPPPKKDEEK